jgi:hypothetical protein
MPLTFLGFTQLDPKTPVETRSQLHAILVEIRLVEEFLGILLWQLDKCVRN